MAGFSDLAAKVTDAFRGNLCDPATWRVGGSGDPQPGVPIMLTEPDVNVAIGLGRATVATVLIQVFKVDISAPASKDTVQLETVEGVPNAAARLFKIIGEPMLDAPGELWTCEATELPVG